MSARMFKAQVHEQLLAAFLGKKLMMRSMAWFELLACRVASTKLPRLGEIEMPYSMVFAIADFADEKSRPAPAAGCS